MAAPVLTAATSYPGYLSYPDDVLAEYPHPSAPGELIASASWVGTAELTLSASCPGVATSSSGGSGVSVTFDGSLGPCTVTLSEPPQSTSTVSYVLTIGPGAR